MGEVDWIPAAVVLGVGIVLGAIVAWRAASPGGRSTGEDPDARDLRARFDALMLQLRELDDLASKRTAGQLAAERAALELEAARILRELEKRRTAAENRSAAAPGPPASRPISPALKGFLWGAGSVAAIALLLVLVWRGTSDRRPGGSLTGGPTPPATGGGPMVDLASLRRAVEASPNDLEARVELAQTLLIAQDLAGVFEQTQFVLERNPDHARALSYQSLVRIAMGDLGAALEMASRATRLEPNDPEPLLHLAIVHVQRGERGRAEAVLEEAIRRFPADAPALEGLLAEVRRSGVPPSEQATPPPVPPQALSGRVRVRLELAGGGSRGGIVFVTVRPEGETSGRPLAVRREAPGAFPAEVEITAADSMTGRLPERMRVEARLDADGDPASVGPGDLAGAVEGVAPGDLVTITLRRP
ncbi:MAG TPA: tetratricopeptide repeat protein [Thermoanaerobaculia bacterium]|nr:tetratricopeptide repeat protein [Thermoanaerobaculia bacterium]